MPKSWTETEGEMSDIELQAAKEYAERFQGGNSVSAFRWLATIDALRAKVEAVTKEREEALGYEIKLRAERDTLSRRLEEAERRATEQLEKKDDAISALDLVSDLLIYTDPTRTDAARGAAKEAR